MNKDKNIFYLLLIPFLGIALWVMYFLLFVEHSAQIRLPITGYDPRNLLSGHYISYRIDWDKADCNQANWNGECPRTTFKTSYRFYVPEETALSIERAINRPETKAEIIYSYQEGKQAVARELLINGQSFRSYK